jgi:hypothetical protein
MVSNVSAIRARYESNRRAKTQMKIHPYGIGAIGEEWRGRYGFAVTRPCHRFEFHRNRNGLAAIDPFDTSFLIRAT